MDILPKKNRGLEFALFCISLALMVAAVGFLSLNKKIVQKLELKQQQVSSLIDEIGKVREENQSLSDKVQYQDQNFEALVRMVKEERAASPEPPAKPAEEKIPVKKVEPLTPVVQAISAVDTEVSTDASPQSDGYFDLLIVGTHSKLTDTIIVARFDEVHEKIVLVSLPRDLSVSGRKINEFYEFYGVEELMKQVKKATGMTIDHYAVVNMNAFTAIVDALSGLDVNVEKGLSDAQYPGPNLTYSAYSVAKGWHHFDGAEALKFARSRKSTSDFDRAKRQQQILEAAKKKVYELKFLDDFQKAREFYSGIFSLLETDIGFIDGLAYLQKYAAYAMQTGEVLSTANYLNSTVNVKGQYILLPKGRDFSAIHRHMLDLTAD